MSRVLVFPPSFQADAAAYKVAADAEYAATYEPGGTFTNDPRNDRYGNWVVSYYGPNFTWDGVNEVQEPASMVPLRVNGVIQSTVDWPEDV